MKMDAVNPVHYVAKAEEVVDLIIIFLKLFLVFFSNLKIVLNGKKLLEILDVLTLL